MAKKKGRKRSTRPAKKPAAVNPSAMTAGDAAKVLAKASGLKINGGMIAADVAAGAPANADGTLNLVHYTAWLVRQAG